MNSNFSNGVIRFLIIGLLFFALLSFQPVQAQMKSGIRAGLNYPDLSILNPQNNNGFHMGTYLKISLAGVIALEPGIQYSQRKFYINPNDNNQTVNLKYLDVPLVFRMSILPFVHVFGGPQASVLLGKRYRGLGSFDTVGNLPKQELGGVAGIGFKLPLGINAQASYDFGLSSLEYNGHNIKNRIVKVSIGKDF